jgi:uncharacterized protein YigE (DUF2233 family)
MKINNKISMILSQLLLLAMLFCTPACDQAPDYNNTYDNTTATTAVAKKIVADTGLVGHVLSDRTYTIVTGVEATEFAYISYEGFPTRVFIMEVDLNNPAISIVTSLPDAGTSFKMQRMTEQAIARDNKMSTEGAGNKVWAGVNADFFNTTTGVPRGPVHQGGVALKTNFDSGERGVFYITTDKTASTATNAQYPDIDNIQEAVGGSVQLVTENQLVVQTDTGLEPRTAIGASEDGKTVYIMVTDGRYPTYSNGMRYEELGRFLQSLGAYNAINLDGGGSSTYFIRTTPEYIEDRFEIRNWPCDNGGDERAVADGLLIISNE